MKLRILFLVGVLVGVAQADSWPMLGRDMQHTGRAEFVIPTERLNDGLFDVFRWQTLAAGPVGSSSMVFTDRPGLEPEGVVAAGYHWPKGVQVMDRHTGALQWANNPRGGENIGAHSPAFSPDGQSVYVINDATESEEWPSGHPLMAMAVDGGGLSYRHNGLMSEPWLVQMRSPTIAPDGRIFAHAWVNRPGAALDTGSELVDTWTAATGADCGNSDPTLFWVGGQLRVVIAGRNGWVRCYDGTTGSQLWARNTYSSPYTINLDATVTVDPATGNLFVGGFNSTRVFVVGLNSSGGLLWSTAGKVVATGSNHRVQNAGCLSHDGATYYFASGSQSSASGALYAINTVNGTVKWIFATSDQQDGEQVGSCPVVTPNGVVLFGANWAGRYYAVQDAGATGVMVDELVVAPGGAARCAPTLSGEGLLYLPLRTEWTTRNAGAVPDHQVHDLFAAVDLSATPYSFEPSRAFLPTDPCEAGIVGWSASSNGAHQLGTDSLLVHSGTSSVVVHTTGDQLTIQYSFPSGTCFDVSNSTLLRAWTQVQNDFPFQIYSPRVRIGGDGGYYEYNPTWDLLTSASGEWVELQIPLAGGGGWTRTSLGAPDWACVHWIQFYADTWDWDFTWWLDGMSFDPVGSGTDCNGNGVADAEDVDSGFSQDANGSGLPDECECEPVALPLMDIALPFSGSGSTVGAPDVIGSAAGEVAYRFTVDVHSQLSITTCSAATTFDAVAYLFAGSGPCEGGQQLLFTAGNGCGGGFHGVDFEAIVEPGVYTVLISGSGLAEGSFELGINSTFVPYCRELDYYSNNNPNNSGYYGIYPHSIGYHTYDGFAIRVNPKLTGGLAGFKLKLLNNSYGVAHNGVCRFSVYSEENGLPGSLVAGPLDVVADGFTGDQALWNDIDLSSMGFEFQGNETFYVRWQFIPASSSDLFYIGYKATSDKIIWASRILDVSTGVWDQYRSNQLVGDHVCEVVLCHETQHPGNLELPLQYRRLDLGVVSAAQNETVTLKARNTGALPLTVTGIVVDDPERFQVALSGLPLQLDPEQTLTFSVGYTAPVGDVDRDSTRVRLFWDDGQETTLPVVVAANTGDLTKDWDAIGERQWFTTRTGANGANNLGWSVEINNGMQRRTGFMHHYYTAAGIAASELYTLVSNPQLTDLDLQFSFTQRFADRTRNHVLNVYTIQAGAMNFLRAYDLSSLRQTGPEWATVRMSLTNLPDSLAIGFFYGGEDGDHWFIDDVVIQPACAALPLSITQGPTDQISLSWPAFAGGTVQIRQSVEPYDFDGATLAATAASEAGTVTLPATAERLFYQAVAQCGAASRQTLARLSAHPVGMSSLTLDELVPVSAATPLPDTDGTLLPEALLP